MSATREEVYKAIDSERAYQDLRWPEGHEHELESWLLYMEDYINEAKHLCARGSTTNDFASVRHILRKVGALAVAAMEEHGAYKR